MRALGWFFLLIPIWLPACVLQDEIRRDLLYIGFPNGVMQFEEKDILDVAVIGGGHSGMSICYGLQREGISNLAVFDSAPEKLEGPWLTTARMLTLRSKKDAPGPAFGMPNLTFQAWYKALYNDWDSLGKIPTHLWAEYLQWYREVLKLPVKNNWKLLHVVWEKDHFRLFFNENREVCARKIVLATGGSGCGGLAIPDFVQDLPKSCWYHTGEFIDPAILEGKRVFIIGNGASGFDIAAVALESGAEWVKMVMRRKELPKVNLFSQSSYWPGYFYLCDGERYEFFRKANDAGIPPPQESIDRIAMWDNFELVTGTSVQRLSFVNDEIVMETNRGPLTGDYLMLATGFNVDVCSVPELSICDDKILLWGDRIENISPKYARFPYLGEHFELLEKNPDSAPYLKHIYCFNYGAYLSHGRIAGDIDQLPNGVDRLSRGIALDIFLDSPDRKDVKCCVKPPVR